MALWRVLLVSTACGFAAVGIWISDYFDRHADCTMQPDPGISRWMGRIFVVTLIAWPTVLILLKRSRPLESTAWLATTTLAVLTLAVTGALYCFFHMCA